ncbi:MAG: alpha/beta hydrolase domain-containing protein [Trebonia sp.]
MPRPAPTVALVERDAGDRPFHSPARWAGCPASGLDTHGYRVDEYLVAGAAHWYVHSPEAGGAVIDLEHPEPMRYQTRAYVVRPRDPGRFSGNVIVEQLNPSMRVDFSMLWSDVGRLAMADGDICVAFTYKKVAADSLRLLDPDRYGGLDIPSDRVGWDLFRDVLEVSRAASGVSVLGEDLASAANVIVSGGSQAGGFVHSFIAEGLHEPADGERRHPTADGYLINVSSGEFGLMGFIPLHLDGEMTPSPEGISDFFASHQCPLDDPRRISRGLEVPVVQWLSETEALQDWWVARPDSDRSGDLYRCYQVPGRGHGAGLLPLEGLQADAAALRSAGIPTSLAGFRPPASHPESAYLLSALLSGMCRWRHEGTPLPRVARIEMEAASYVRRDAVGWHMRGLAPRADDLGHSLGGVRYPTIDYALARMYEEPGAAITPMWHREPMSRDEVARRYGSAGRWLILALSSLDDAIARGMIRADHAEAFAEFLWTCRP